MPLESFGTLDIAAAAVVFVLVLFGAMKGMARLVLGFAGVALGWVLAVRHSESLARMLGAGEPARDLGWEPIRLAAFLIVFIGTAIAAGLIAWLVTRLLGAAHMRWLDRLAGSGLGLLLAIVLLCAGSIPVLALVPADGPLVRDSRIMPYAVAGGDYLKQLAPEPLRSRFTNQARALFERPSLGAPTKQEAAAR